MFKESLATLPKFASPSPKEARRIVQELLDKAMNVNTTAEEAPEGNTIIDPVTESEGSSLSGFAPGSSVDSPRAYDLGKHFEEIITELGLTMNKGNIFDVAGAASGEESPFGELAEAFIHLETDANDCKDRMPSPDSILRVPSMIEESPEGGRSDGALENFAVARTTPLRKASAIGAAPRKEWDEGH